MDISNIIYSGVDIREFESYSYLKDILINRVIEIENENIKSIYKITIEIKNNLNETIEIISKINLENKKLNKYLGDFTLNINCIIEYLREDNSLGIKELSFKQQEYMDLPFKISKEKIISKIRNIQIYKTFDNNLYLSIYYIITSPGA